MKNKSTSIKLLSVFVLAAIFTSSCGKDPVSSREKAPKLPEIQQVEPDFSYFENGPDIYNKNLPEMADAEIEYGNFYEAQMHIWSFSLYTAFASLYSGWFLGIDEEEVVFRDGQWVWNWGYSYGGASVSITYTGEERANSFLWNMTWSFNDGEGGAVQDYNMISGEVAKDGKSGEWNFNEYDDDTQQSRPMIKTVWTKESDTNASLSTTLFDDGVQEGVFTYNQNGADFSVNFNSDGDSEPILISWNTDTMTGFYQSGNDPITRLCWDNTYSNIEC